MTAAVAGGRPLDGVTVIEMRGIGPGPLSGMMLADMGARVIRVDSPRPDDGLSPPDHVEAVHRGKESIQLDLKTGDGRRVLDRLVIEADILIEGYRPGVAERLGFGPDRMLELNPALVFGRLTGWGQTGPYAQAAGHDLNYLSVAGAVYGMGEPTSPPPPPLAYVGDYGSGTMFLLFGVLCALYESRSSGRGQVVDAAMIDGAAALGTQLYSLLADNKWTLERGKNLLDGSAPFYRAYECSDGQYISVGCNEPRFYAELMRVLGLGGPDWEEQYDTAAWPQRSKELAARFAGKTRDQWCREFVDADACFAPVLNLKEATEHPHNVERATFMTSFGVTQPSPAPRLSRTPAAVRGAPPARGAHTDVILRELGFDESEVAGFIESGSAIQHTPR